MSPEQIREINIRALAESTIDGLCCNSKKPTAMDILDHAAAQACVELELIESVLGEHEMAEGPLALLSCVVDGIRRRLALARSSASSLADLVSEAAE